MVLVSQKMKDNGAAAFGYLATNVSKFAGNLSWALGKTGSCVLGVIAFENVEECVRRVWDEMPDLVNINLCGYDVTDLQQEYLPDSIATPIAIALVTAVAAKAVDRAGRALCKSCCSISKGATQLPKDKLI